MAYPKRILEVVEECNDEQNNPTCWAMCCGEDGEGHRHFIWVTKYDKGYVVEDSNGYNRLGDKVYKTLAGAKKAAEGVAWRQEETGYFSD